MLVNLTELTKDAAKRKYIIGSFNVYGYEEAWAAIRGAEEMNAPVVLLTNKTAFDYMDLEYYAALFKKMAESAKVPVCIQLEHAREYSLIEKAIKEGYTSVMYDGSQLPLKENIENTKKVVELAHRFGISVEAEIGAVGYKDLYTENKEIYTEPEEAKIFVTETNVDALAISIGTVHRMQNEQACIQYERLEEIQKRTEVPSCASWRIGNF